MENRKKMVDPGITNPAFETDETSDSDITLGQYGPLEPSHRWREPLPSFEVRQNRPVTAIEMQMIQRKNRKHRKSASVGTPIQWTQEESTPAKVLRAWTDAQISCDMEGDGSNSSDSSSDEGRKKSHWKARGTQTEEHCAAISSWKILTTLPHPEPPPPPPPPPPSSSSPSPSFSEYEGNFTTHHQFHQPHPSASTEDGDRHIASYPHSKSESLPAKPSNNNKEYVVIETRSLGFEASTQTKEAFLFRHSDAEAFEMIMAWRMVTIFLPITWYMIMYVADQATDVVVTVGFCYDHDWWWCGLSLAFLFIPHFAINAYAYEQLVRPDIASVAPVNKWLARGLLAAQIAPHYLIGRKWSWCFRAWKKVSWRMQRRQNRKNKGNNPSSSTSAAATFTDPENLKPQKHRKSAKILWEQAKAETYSETVKLYQSLLVSTPQLAIQAYVLMVKWQGDDHHSSYVEPVLITSVVISLTSASSGLASVLADNAWEKIAASTAIFLTLGCRVLVLGAVGTIASAYWFIPVCSAVFVGVVTKICESKETTPLPILVKMHKYFSEAFVMATVCPPFNALGVFTSVPYVLAGFVFLLREPGGATNIVTFIFSIFGQVAWLAVGFFVT